MSERAREILNTIFRVPYDNQAVNACVADNATFITILNRPGRKSIMKVMNKEQNEAFVMLNHAIPCKNRDVESFKITCIGSNLYSYRLCHCQTLEGHSTFKDGVYLSRSKGCLQLNDDGFLIHFLYENAIPKIKRN